MQIEIVPSRSWRKNYEPAAVLLLALLWHPLDASAAAQDTAASMFSISGFGTAGLVHSSEDSADYTASPLQPDGAGYTHPWSPDIDSRLGAQVTARFTSQLFAMVQVVSEQGYDKSYKPHFEWANIAYQPTPEFGVRVGRIVLPTFLISDSRKVGYAHPWARPPVEFYALSPIYDSDGADANYRLHLGDAVNTWVATIGNARFRAVGGGEFRVNHLWVIADTVEYRSLTLHVAYQASSFTFEALNPLFDAFREFGPQGMVLADKYDLDNKHSELLTAGALYDPGRWFVTGEWGRRNLHSAIGESTAWYLSSGYRLTKFTPYLTYATVKADSKTSDPGLNVSVLPHSLAGPAMGLNTALNALLGSAPVQDTMSVGARWDVVKNVDLKMQFDHVDLGAGSAGALINVQPGFQRGGTVNLFSIVIDFVW